MTVETDALAQGLTTIAETQGAHTGLLEAILAAVTAETPDSPLPDLLERLARGVEALVQETAAQRAVLERLEATQREQADRASRA